MADRSGSSDNIEIDPLFPIPYGAEDQFVYTREGADSDSDDGEFSDFATDAVESIYEDSENFYEFDDGYEDQNGATLETPETFAIVSQLLRRGPGGQQVVDIVIQTEDIDGAVNYEMQVTKI